MPGLNDLPTVSLRGRLVGAYDDQYLVVGLDTPVSGTELLTYILDNLGGGGGNGINDVTEGTSDPTGVPGTGEPSIYQNTTSGTIFVWDGSGWEAVLGGDNDVTEASGAPINAPGTGEPEIYQNTDNGELYIWNGSTWDMVGAGEDDITEGSGIPSGPPALDAPDVYQNTDNGDLYVWNGTAWVLIGGGDNDITEDTGAPSGAPGAGEPAVYQDTNNGNLYVWNGTSWVLVSGVEDDITEGAGTPSGVPGAGEPVIYQDTTNGNVYTWDGSQWNIMAVVASNGLTKTGPDVELGGTLEKNTDVEVSTFTLRFGRLLGNLLAYLRIVPGTGLINIFTRNVSANVEASLDLQPGLALIEVDNSSQAGQISMTPKTIDARVSQNSDVRNRLLLDTDKLELTNERLEFKMASAQSGAVGHVLTLVNVVSGEAVWQPPSTDRPPLPVYNSIASAVADGLVTGDQFKLSQPNTEGGVAGTVIEIL